MTCVAGRSWCGRSGRTCSDCRRAAAADHLYWSLTRTEPVTTDETMRWNGGTIPAVRVG